MSSSHAQRRPLLPRLVLLIALVVIVGDGLLSAVRLHRAPAPFHTPFREASEATQAEVTQRIVRGVIVLPVALSAVLVLSGALLRKPRAGFIAGAVVALLASAHATLVLMTLPYGAGSDYEHASETQMLHLKLAYAMANGAFVLAVALGAAPYLQQWIRRQRVSA